LRVSLDTVHVDQKRYLIYLKELKFCNHGTGQIQTSASFMHRVDNDPKHKQNMY